MNKTLKQLCLSLAFAGILGFSNAQCMERGQELNLQTMHQLLETKLNTIKETTTGLKEKYRGRIWNFTSLEHPSKSRFDILRVDYPKHPAFETLKEIENSLKTFFGITFENPLVNQLDAIDMKVFCKACEIKSSIEGMLAAKAKLEEELNGYEIEVKATIKSTKK